MGASIASSGEFPASPVAIPKGELVEPVVELEMEPEEAASILSTLRRDHRLVITVTRMVGEERRS